MLIGSEYSTGSSTIVGDNPGRRRFAVPYTGEYDLTRATAFLEGWPPTAADVDDRQELTWATCADGTWQPLSVTVGQREKVLLGAYLGEEVTSAKATAETRRILSVDVDARNLAQVSDRDEIAGGLIRASPGLRPVCFWTPYEAAVWGVISQRMSMTGASTVKRRIAETHGTEIGGLRAFPSPRRLLRVTGARGLGLTKVGRLHHVARAALEGRLDAEALRGMEVGRALESLRRIPGVGPFTAELILVRGAGHPDVFPSHERRLHEIMRHAYQLADAEPDDLAAVAARWRPYRSWVGFLFRSGWAPVGGKKSPTHELSTHVDRHTERDGLQGDRVTARQR